jgi:signal transduction histidine kinase
MARWERLVSTVNGAHLVFALGALYVALAAGRTFSVVASGGAIPNAVIDFVLVGSPGLALLYAGDRLPRAEVPREVHPRIAAWCLGAAAVLLGVVGLLVLDSEVTISQPAWSATLAAAIGSFGGLAIGTNEARAITRAHEAEEHEQELKRQNERLESFASMLAHEVRNPLNIAQIYLPQAADGDAAATEEVETALGRIEEMIEILLVTARSDDASLARKEVALSAVAEDAWADLGVERATLVVETDRALRVDPVHLRHLLENLFRNAVEHAGSDVTVRVGSLQSGFYVADDGPGISVADREAVFEAGYTTEAGGIGLGLTFVAQLVETYGWDCRLVESESGGARFEFRNVEVVERRERRPE